ncbi:molybdate ABC transporter permease subunit [Ureibacillus xyleni]
MDLLLNNLFWSPVWISIKTAIVAGVFVIILGTLVGYVLSKKKFKGKILIETILMLPIVLPPTVIGFFLIIIFGQNSYIGQFIEWIFRQPIIFTWWAAVFAAIIVAFPLMYQSAKSGFSSIDKSIEDAARIDGASEWKVFLFISIPLASKSLLSGSILSFARALGEFGATLMFAGNIPGKTQTLPTAIYLAIDGGEMALAWTWVIAIVFISFIMMFILQIKQK